MNSIERNARRNVPFEHTAIDAVLNQLHAHFERERHALQPEPPRVLYHYTDAKGLIGILDSNRLHATHYRFVNDTSEINYGATIFSEVVDSRLNEDTTPVVREFLTRARGTANGFDQGMFECFVACFCQDDD